MVTPPPAVTCDRLVLFGSPLAGKTTILQAVESRFGGLLRHEAAEGGCDRVLVWRGRVGDRECRLSTAPGSVWDFRSWTRLFETASGVVLVIDPLTEFAESVAECLLRFALIARRPPVLFVQLTKQDLGEKGFSFWIDASRSPFADGVPVTTSRSDRPETLPAGLEALWSP